MKDPGGCDQTDPADAEPGEEQRLPRSPRRLHPARRRRSPGSPLRTCRRSVSHRRSEILLNTLDRPGLLLSFFFSLSDLSSFSSFGFWLHPRHRTLSKRLGLSSASQHPAQGSPLQRRIRVHTLKLQQKHRHPIICRLTYKNTLRFRPSSHFSCPKSDPPHHHPLPPPLCFPVQEEVFSWSHRQDRQGAPSAGWGDWRDLAYMDTVDMQVKEHNDTICYCFKS